MINILYLTWGESVSLVGIYRSQVLDLLMTLKKKYPDLNVALYSGLPVVNRALVEEKLAYFKYIDKIKNLLQGSGIKWVWTHLWVPPLSFYSNVFERIFYIEPYIKKFTEFVNSFDPDIIHCRSYWATYIAILVRKKTNRSFKVVFDPRGNAPEEAIFKRPILFRNRDFVYWSMLEKRLLLGSDAVVCISKGMGENYRKKHGIERSFYYIYTSADVEAFFPKVSKARAKKAIGLNEEIFVAGYSGALGNNEWHNTTVLLDLFSVLKKHWSLAKLLIVTRSNHYEIIESFKKRFFKEDLLIFAAYKKEEILNYYWAMDVGILSYRKEGEATEKLLANAGLAVKTGEYLAAGLPVIVNERLSSVRDLMMKNNIGVTYSLGQEDKIIEPLVSLMKDKELGKRCIDEARSSFDLKVNAERYVNLYKEILNNDDKI